ncbi:MAG: hypothetical protein KGJ58_03370 [Patescibacteria group bacterium]|nr:hypothetical protein [Patescibacteria group bacterium]MDE2218462.1 hypothetical protein [Patescibacteria group bacterium]
MDILIGVGYFIGFVFVFSFYLTFCEVMDKLYCIREEKKTIRDLFKYWPVSLWLIVLNGIREECEHGRVIPRPTEKKGGQIEE